MNLKTLYRSNFFASWEQYCSGSNENVSLQPKSLKMYKLRYLLFFLFLFQGMLLSAQDYHFGIRAGLSFAKFLGPAEEGVTEQFNINDGFHFGIIGTMELNEYFSIGTEILYNQLGTSYQYEGPSYYKVNTGEVDFLKENLKYNLDITNSYINIPIMLHIHPIKKLELVVGGYMGFLVNPVAGGKYEFGNSFRQYPEFNYYSDKAGGVPFGAQYEILNVIVTQPDESEEIVQIHKTPGAYYQYNSDQFNDDTGTFFNWFDLGATAGVTYFINSSLYAAVRADITNKNLDRSLKDVDEEGNFILRDDFDSNLNFQISLGFKF